MEHPTAMKRAEIAALADRLLARGSSCVTDDATHQRSDLLQAGRIIRGLAREPGGEALVARAGPRGPRIGRSGSGRYGWRSWAG
jgi:hypothetical protein